MPDYKKAFEILKDKFEMEIHKTNLGTAYDRHSCVTEYGFTLHEKNKLHYFDIAKEEYDCLNDCLNSEPDSIEKIIQDANESSGWECTLNETHHIIFKKSTFGTHDIILEIEYRKSVKGFYAMCSYKNEPMPIWDNELDLINRIKTIWEV